MKYNKIKKAIFACCFYYILLYHDSCYFIIIGLAWNANGDVLVKSAVSINLNDSNCQQKCTDLYSAVDQLANRTESAPDIMNGI